MLIDRELTTKCWVGFIDWLDVREHFLQFRCANGIHPAGKYHGNAHLSNRVRFKSPFDQGIEGCHIKNLITRSSFDLDRCHLACLRIDIQGENSFRADALPSHCFGEFGFRSEHSQSSRLLLRENGRFTSERGARACGGYDRRAQNRREHWSRYVIRCHTSNENKMSDGGRGRASLGVKVWKSSQKWSVRRSAVRSIVWLGLCGFIGGRGATI